MVVGSALARLCECSEDGFCIIEQVRRDYTGNCLDYRFHDSLESKAFEEIPLVELKCNILCTAFVVLFAPSTPCARNPSIP